MSLLVHHDSLRLGVAFAPQDWRSPNFEVDKRMHAMIGCQRLEIRLLKVATDRNQGFMMSWIPVLYAKTRLYQLEVDPSL